MEEADDIKTIDVDAVLPPDAPGARAGQESATGPKAMVKKALPSVMARLLDEIFTIPGTGIKIGLDPILGFLFPVIGDAATATAGVVILREGVRRRVPRKVLMRMGVNIMINAGLGAIPILGDIFSIWFRSNTLNYALLQRHATDPALSDFRPSLWPLFAFLVGLFGMISLIVWGMVALCRSLFGN